MKKKFDLQLSPTTPLLFNPVPSDGKMTIGKNDFSLTPSELKNRAHSGEANAQLLIGLAYKWGWHNSIMNWEEAKTWVILAANSKDSPAGLCAQGLCCEWAIGTVVIKNRNKARQFFTQAADQGYIPAMYHLAMSLADDEISNVSTGTSTSSGSDSKGNDITLFNTHKTYHTNQDRREQIIKLVTQCAEAGYSQAQGYLSWCYRTGWSVSQDNAQAYRLARMSAESGCVYGKYQLSYCYLNGIGVAKSMSEAETWMQAAADQNYMTAREDLRNHFGCGAGCLIL